MRKILRPTFEMLTPEQFELVYNIMKHFEQVNFSHTKLSSPIEVRKAVSSIASVCKNEENLRIFVDFVEQMMRWYRIPGFYLSFYLQLYTRSNILMLSEHITACLIYSNAQINLNNDLAFDSTEVAYNSLLKVKNMISPDKMSDSLANKIMHLETVLINRLEFFYSFFLRWRKPFKGLECNPLVDNLYYSLTHKILASVFSDLNFRDDDKIEASYLSVIRQCQHEDFRYYRILARRFLGVWYLGNKKISQAIDQLTLGLEEAKAIDLETEFGHFQRLLGYVLLMKGDLQKSAHHFFEAYKIDSPSCASYWRSIDARELAYVLRRAGPLRVKLPEFSSDSSNLLQISTKFYEIGRDLFDKHMIDSSNLPINKAIKLQMFRCYSENAIEQALMTDNFRDVIAEIETNSPSEIVQLEAELKAAHDLTLTSISDLQKTREVLHRHLSTLPSTFEDYLASFSEYYHSRHAYLKKVISLNEKWLPFRPTSTDVVDKTLQMKLPNSYFLLFNIGRLSTYALINMANGKIKSDRAWFTETQLDVINKKYIMKLGKITEKMTLKQKEDVRKRAVDFLLKEYEKLLVPIIEPALSEISNSHLKIFPRLQMNAVPIHALKIGDKRLIETCDVSYNQNLNLFLNIHANEVDELSKAPLVVYDKEGTAGFLNGTIRTIEEGFAEKSSILIDSNWPEILEAIKNSKAIDLFFACHGSYDTSNPALSYLKVCSSEKVFFSKIFSDLNLSQHRSVVLGACESGLVKAELASEYVGLASAFLAAGVRYFIGSLWKVNEFVSSILLSSYFELLSLNKYTIPKALNGAQRKVMKMSRDKIIDWVESRFPREALNELKPEIEAMDYYPYRHPYYWAGFYVSGDI